MSKHTPGPWVTFNTLDIFTKLGAPNAEGTNAPSNDGWMIADCDMGSLSIAEVRANTLLIAAAPELLEALNDVLAGTAWSCIAEHSLEKAQAAIAKATGAQP